MKRPAPTNVLIAGLLLGLWLSSAVPSVAAAQEAPARRDAAGARGRDEKRRTADPRWEDRKRGGPQGEFRTDVPDHPLDIILGRPTQSSITLSVLAYRDLEGYIAYGTQEREYTSETPQRRFPKGQPVEVVLAELTANTRYYYQFRSRDSVAAPSPATGDGTFCTARPPGQWGDALFLVLDPFWYTPRQRGADDNWNRTLGTTQYQWLQQTLEQSRAAFKFVFIHHLVGGASKEGRGGVEAAPFYEWGGRNADGTDGFREHRPGWPLPIHQLLVQHRVAAVFHGHDHLYVKQDLGGLVYQEVPQPGAPGWKNTRTAKEYGYLSGVLLGSSGHLRLRVAPVQTTVDYVRSCLPEDERSDRRNAAVGDSLYHICQAERLVIRHRCAVWCAWAPRCCKGSTGRPCWPAIRRTPTTTSTVPSGSFPRPSTSPLRTARLRCRLTP